MYPPIQSSTRFAADVRPTASCRRPERRSMPQAGRGSVRADARCAQGAGRVGRVELGDAEVACLGRGQEVVFGVERLYGSQSVSAVVRDC